MSEKLSTEEIDKLLEAIKSGDNGEADDYKPVDSRKIRMFDFVNPPTFSPTEIAKVSCLIENIACRLAKKWSDDYKTQIYCNNLEPFEISRHHHYKELTNYYDEKMEGRYILSENDGEYKVFLISDLATDFTKSTAKQSMFTQFSGISKDFFEELSKQITENTTNSGKLAQNTLAKITDFKIKSSLYMSSLNPRVYSYYAIRTNPSCDAINDNTYGCTYEGKKDMGLEFDLVFKNENEHKDSKNIRRFTVILSYNLVQLVCCKTQEINPEIIQDNYLPPFADKVLVNVSVSFGKTEKKLKAVRNINEGTIMELDRRVGDPVIIYAGGTPIAKGEIIILDEHFGIRIEEIM
jgi:flagellar motor switch protein FliN